MIAVDARPYEFELPEGKTMLVVIDMQRDFIEPGGFGESRGNDVSRLQSIIPTTAALIALFRRVGWPILHTREAHKPDLSDCPPSKVNRGRGPQKIGDPGPMGRLLVAGEPGNQIVPELAPIAGEMELDKPGKGMFWATGIHEVLQEKGITLDRRRYTVSLNHSDFVIDAYFEAGKANVRSADKRTATTQTAAPRKSQTVDTVEEAITVMAQYLADETH